MADNKRRGRFGRGSADESNQSIFDLFEPPPDAESESTSFGKIPIIRDDDDDEVDLDLTDGELVEAQAAAEAEAAGLAHWTEPATGQVPAALASELGEKSADEVKGPSWHGEDPNWDGPDLSDVFADTAAITHDRIIETDDDELAYDAAPPPPRAARPRPEPRSPERPQPRPRQPAAGAERPVGPPPTPTAAPAAPSVFDRPAAADARPAATGAPSVFDRPTPGAAAAPPPVAPPPDRPRPTTAPPTAANADQARGRVAAPPPAVGDPVRERPAPTARGAHDAAPGAGGIGGLDLEEELGLPAVPPPERPGRADGGRRRARRPVDDELPGDEFDDYDDEGYEHGLGEESGGRNFGQSLLVGIALAAVVFITLGFGPVPSMVLIGLLTLLAVMELFNAMRIAGLRPATLLGLVGAVAIPAATYVRGEAGYPLVIGLAVVFGMLWYLTGADTERPVLNLGLTLMGIAWVGGLAGFAALMLREDGGIGLLLAAILITTASDTLAYIGGRAYGTKPFHTASPNKTWEGTLTGFFGALFAGLVIGVTDFISVFDGEFVSVMVLAAVVGVLAPIGDLAESLIKRDLGIKDMGTLLPGHGGVLDRVDGLLFALPGAYYVATIYQLI